MNPEEVKEELQKPFSAKDIEWRVARSMNTNQGKSIAFVLAYVTNRAIMNRLDDLFGVNGWKNEYVEWRDKGTKCRLSIHIGDGWITKEDGSDETNIEGTKGGFSGSMKRTAVQFGIGRYLYDLSENIVNIQEKKPSGVDSKTVHYINDKKANVKGYWVSPNLPDWALPKGEPRKTNKPTNVQKPMNQKENEIEEPQKITSSTLGSLKTAWLNNGYDAKKLEPQIKKIYKVPLTGLTEMQAIKFLERLEQKESA